MELNIKQDVYGISRLSGEWRMCLNFTHLNAETCHTRVTVICSAELVLSSRVTRVTRLHKYNKTNILL